LYALFDTFNERIVSRHRTVRTAAKAKGAFLRRVEAANGPGSYVPVICRKLDSDALVPLSDGEMSEFLYYENND
jgi:hypothetical protein